MIPVLWMLLALHSKGAEEMLVVAAGAPLDHPDFGANLWTNAAEADGQPGVDDDHNGVVDDVHGAAFLNGVASGDVKDANAHGSWTTGAVAATTNNGLGIASVPRTVTLIPCRYLDATGNGQVSDGLRCWDYCMAQGSQVSFLQSLVIDVRETPNSLAASVTVIHF